MSRRDNQGNTYWVWVLVKKETPKAYLLHDGVRDGWCPKSQIMDRDGDEPGEGVITRLEIAGWICEEKDFNTDNSREDVEKRPKQSANVDTPKTINVGSGLGDKSYDDDLPF
jgi:hypothetical protein